MNGVVAYSRPRGVYGRYVFTVAINFIIPGEKVEIKVSRSDHVYKCDHCGRWVTITKITNIAATEHTLMGSVDFFRYDNVEPGDIIEITLQDPELLFFQKTTIKVKKPTTLPKQTLQSNKGPTTAYTAHRKTVQEEHDFPVTHTFLPYRKNPTLVKRPTQLYDILIINWDKHFQQSQNRTWTVEEELIQKTMNAEPITIKELYLEQPNQLSIEGAHQFIEGNLRYIND